MTNIQDLINELVITDEEAEIVSGCECDSSHQRSRSNTCYCTIDCNESDHAWVGWSLAGWMAWDGVRTNARWHTQKTIF